MSVTKINSDIANGDIFTHLLQGNLDIVYDLISDGANVNAIHINYGPLLTIAVSKNYVKIVELLIKKGANVHVWNDDGLITAVKCGNLDMVRLLVENSADIHVMDDEPIISALMNERWHILKYLVSIGANANACHGIFGPLINMAWKKNYVDIFYFLLKNGANVDSNNHELIVMAVTTGNFDAVENLLLCGANVNSQNIFSESLLCIAILNKHWKIVDLLIQNHALMYHTNENDLSGRKINYESNDKAIVCALENNHPEIVKYVIKNGGNPNARNKKHISLICVALEKKYFDLFYFLIENGANIHANNDLCILMACESGYLDIVKYLVEKGANINSNNSLVLMAAIYNFPQIVEYLLKMDANPNSCDGVNGHILKIAAKKNYFNVVVILTQKTFYSLEIVLEAQSIARSHKNGAILRHLLKIEKQLTMKVYLEKSLGYVSRSF